MSATPERGTCGTWGQHDEAAGRIVHHWPECPWELMFGTDEPDWSLPGSGRYAFLCCCDVISTARRFGFVDLPVAAEPNVGGEGT